MIPRTVTTHTVALVVGGLIVAIGWGWMQYRPSLPGVVAPPAHKLAGAQKETKDCTKVLAYVPKVKEKLGLPESIQKDDSISVIASADVPRTDRPLIASALLNRGTGVGEIAFTPQPLPWLAFDRRAAIGVAYGAKDGANGFVTRLYGRVDLIQVKRLHAGLLGDVDNAGGWYGGGFAEIRW